MTQGAMLLYGLVYTLIALIFGTLILFLLFKLFNALTRNIDDMREIRQNNVAVALVNSAVVFSVALFVSESVMSAMEAFKNNIIVFGSELTSLQKFKTFGIMFAHFLIASVLSFFVLWLSMRIFVGLTRSVDEFAEIKKNNHAVGILLAVVIISMTIIIKPGVGKLLKGIIHYPLPRARSSVVPFRPGRTNRQQSSQSSSNRQEQSQPQNTHRGTGEQNTRTGQ